MTLTTIYEYEGHPSMFFPILLPLVFIMLICAFLIRYRKFYYRRQVLLKKAILFISYFGLVMSFSFLVIFSLGFIGKGKVAYSELKLNSNNYQVVEGEVENYKLEEINGQCFESFSIENVFFQYSDNVIIRGYHTTACTGGVINKNGIELVITYVVISNENRIVKIQKYQ